MKQRKHGETWLKKREALAENTFLNNNWWNTTIDKNKCSKRHVSEFSETRKPVTKENRPSLSDYDSNWERYCFDFFEPYFLSGCIDELSGGRKNTTYKSSGMQIDISFTFNSYAVKTWPLEDARKCHVICECKKRENFDLSNIESALRNLLDRENQLKNLYKSPSSDSVDFLPLLLCYGNQRPNLMATSDPNLHDIARRCVIINSQDIEYFRNQIRTLGWKASWKIFAYEGLKRQVSLGDTNNIEIPAFWYNLKSKSALTFVMSVYNALQLCHVPRANRNLSNKNLYQRPLKKSRLIEISKTLPDKNKYETCFPNNIVGSLNSTGLGNPDYSLWWEDSNQPDAEVFTLVKNDVFLLQGKMVLPFYYGVFKIIDGQHRLYSYLQAVLDGSMTEEDLKKEFLSFTMMAEINNREEKTMFSSINKEAINVNANLIDVILYQNDEHYTGRGFASIVICKLCFEEHYSKEWLDEKKGFGIVTIGDKDIDGDLKSRVKIHDFVRPFEMSGLTQDSAKGILQIVTNRYSDYEACDAAAELFLNYIKETRLALGRKNLWENHLKRRPGVRLLIYTLANWLRKHSRGDHKLEELAYLISENSRRINTFFESYEKVSVPEDDIEKLAKEIIN
jgi:DGQHR domain-containing protein